MKKFLNPKIVLLIAVMLIVILVFGMLIMTVMSKMKSVRLYAGEGGRVFGAGDFLIGDSVAINAIPDEGYDFAGWYIEGADKQFTERKSSKAHYIFPMGNENIVLKAFFEPISKHRLSASIVDAYNPQSTVTGAAVNGTGEKSEGSTVSLTALASGCTFVGWYYNDVFLSASATLAFSMPKTDTAVEARFISGVHEVYELLLSTTAGGRIESPPAPFKDIVREIRFPAGISVTVEGIANANYMLADWSIDDELTKNESTMNGGKLTFVMPAKNLNVIADFQPRQG